jgi:hypothetical protein
MLRIRETLTIEGHTNHACLLCSLAHLSHAAAQTHERLEVASRVLEKVRSAELEIASPPFTVNARPEFKNSYILFHTARCVRGQHTHSLSLSLALAPKMASGIGGGRPRLHHWGRRRRRLDAGCARRPMVHRGQWPGDYQDWRLYHHGPGSTSSQWATFLNSAPHYGFLGKEPPALRTTAALPPPLHPPPPRRAPTLQQFFRRLPLPLPATNDRPRDAQLRSLRAPRDFCTRRHMIFSLLVDRRWKITLPLICCSNFVVAADSLECDVAGPFLGEFAVICSDLADAILINHLRQTTHFTQPVLQREKIS